MTDLTRPQYRRQRTDSVVALDVAETASSLVALLPNAHLGAALTTTPDTPASGWASGLPSGGDISDPTGRLATSDLVTDHRLTELSAGLAAWRQQGYHLHMLATQLAALLEPDQGNDDPNSPAWRAADELDAENKGAGECTVCERHCDGFTRATRLHPLRSIPPMRVCNACRVSWDAQVKRDQGADIWAWCDARRRHIERTDGSEAV